jgi:hypothetical protein
MMHEFEGDAQIDWVAAYVAQRLIEREPILARSSVGHYVTTAQTRAVYAVG